MAENTAEVLAGAGVLAIAIGFLAYAGQTAGFGGGSDTYPLVASFRAVDGISVGTDVRLAGVKVGTITALTLNPTTFYADAEVQIDKAIVLPDDSAILVSSEGLLGGNYIEIVPGGSADVLAPGAEIEDTQGSVSLVTLLMRFVGAASGDGEGAP
ncbi:MAG: outer membrane lipid asymmetry maintenance protein MlaD [Rhodobacteraceae bacterium]|jgi:phospholipid/cholesterol/gamma-HCH transport system substrate-binding protein|nr:outer membrane lipid asymmetry maintenance protein MlaD [Paracoccaceae bacterium]